MSDNKIGSAGSNGWGVNTLIEGLMGEPEVEQAQRAPASGEAEQRGDAFGGGDEGVADEFLEWAGARARSIGDDAEALIEEGAAKLTTTVGELAQGVREGGAAVARYDDRALENVEHGLRHAADTIRDIRQLDAEDVLLGGLDELGITAERRQKLRADVEFGLDVARNFMDEMSEVSTLSATKDVANSALWGYTALLGGAKEAVEGKEALFDGVKSLGSGMQDATWMTGQAFTPIGALTLSLGAALEKLGDAPAALAEAHREAEQLQVLLEHVDPEQMAERVVNLQDGESVSYKLAMSGEVHEGVGGQLGAEHELKFERKGDKFVAEYKGTLAGGLGVGLGALNEGVSLDAKASRSGTVVIECDDREAIEQLGRILDASVLDGDVLDELELPDSIHVKKVSLEGVHGIDLGAGAPALAALGGNVGVGGSVGVINDVGGDGEASLFIELAGKAEGGVSIKGASGRDDLSPRELREALVEVGGGNIAGALDGLGDDPAEVLLEILQPKAGDAVKIVAETKVNVSAPFSTNGSRVGSEGDVKITLEAKATLEAVGNLAEVETKVEIEDPVGLARDLGMDVATLARALQAGDLTIEDLKGLDAYDHVKIEHKVQHRFKDTAGIVDTASFTGSRTEMAKPIELFSVKAEGGRVETSGVVKDGLKALAKARQVRALPEAILATARPREDVRVQDLAANLIRG